ncbi:MAG TPA: terminase small subunit [Caulobacter sp.]|nr:terminase small subunit [Caulobacter sp.]
MPQHPAPAAPADKPLNLRQQRFVVEYLVDGVAAAAARRAGFSRSQSRWQGTRMLKLARVQAAIAAAREARARPPCRQSVLAELRAIAFANVLDYARPEAGGELVIDLWKLDRDRASAVRELSIVERTDPRTGEMVRTVRFKLADKAAALTRLAAMLADDRRLIEDALERGHLDGARDVLDMEPEQFLAARDRYALRLAGHGARRVEAASSRSGADEAARLRRMRADQLMEGRPPAPSALTCDDLYGPSGDADRDDEEPTGEPTGTR